MKKLILCSILLAPPAAAAQLPRNAGPGRVPHGDIPIKVGVKADLPFGMPLGVLGHWGVGNGGDWLRIGFARAREYAAQIVMRIKPDSLRNIRDPELREWIIQNQKYLAADILQSEHVWELEPKETCAWTVPPDASDAVPKANPIQLSYPTCRQSADGFLKAAQILIHESVHHFNGDETMADQVAIGIIDAWQSGLMDSLPLGLKAAPPGSYRHAAVWTGEQMMVYGGTGEGNAALAKASAYDPRSETWSDLGLPASVGARSFAQTVWTGSELFIWGGFSQRGPQQSEWNYSGALYNAAKKSWELVEAPNWWSPKPLTWDGDPRQTVVWTGDRVIVYGGIDSRTQQALGAIFDPATRSWSPLNTGSDQAPRRIGGHSAVWTGSQMIVWGGYGGDSDSNREITAEGAIYNPAQNSWSRIEAGGAPSPRAGHQAVWTGKKMVVLSGGGVSSQGGLSATGGLFDPETRSWTPLQTELLVERVGHQAIWNGEEVLLIGGRSNRLKTYFGELYAFNPVTLRWRVIAGAKNPEPRFYPSLVWTGSSALVWGGMGADGASLRSGALYFP